MSQFSGMIPALVIALVAATLLTLVAGVLTMGRGGEFGRRWSNKLMQLRVALQGVAILLLALFVYLTVS